MNPTGQPYGAPLQPTRDPRADLNVPSILLLVLGGLGIIFNLYSVVAPTDLSRLDDMALQPEARELVTRLSGVAAGAGRLFSLLGVALGGVMVFGALKMRELQQYPLALASAIIALLPFGSCCCCLSLPVGVWALVILSRAEVKDAFAANAGR
jgi:hypothetical protein